MACSKYISTKEKTNAARVSRLLVDPCTDLFRDILRHYITEIQFPFFLQNACNTLPPILNKVQRGLLYPRSSRFSGTYKDFDLTLLYTLLRNISGIPPHQKGWGKSPNLSDRSLSANIDRIREIRNTYCGHVPSILLPDIEFNKLWQDLTVIISELESSLPGGCTIYTDAAKMIKTDTMDPVRDGKFLNIIDEQHQTTEEVKGTITKVKEEQMRQYYKLDMLESEQQGYNTQLQNNKRKHLQLQRRLVKREFRLTSELTQHQKDMKKELLKHKIEHEKLKMKQSKQEMEIKKLKQEECQEKSNQKNPAKENLFDCESRNIIDNTLAVLKAEKLKKVNIRTSGVQTAVEKLRDRKICILIGKAGSGKTTAAYQVMSEMSDPSEESPYTPVLIKYPEQWDKVINSNSRFIVHLDDVFGSTNLDIGAVEKWKNQLHVIFSCAITGNVIVLLSLRRNILDETKTRCGHQIFDDKYIVDLSSKENLTLNDKQKLLKSYEENCSFKFQESSSIDRYWTVNRVNISYRLSNYEKSVILYSNPYYGFPLTCFQFFSRCDVFNLGPSYFHHPDEKLFEVIENMRRGKCGNINEKVKYCVLCYVFLNRSIRANDVSETSLKEISETIRISNIPEIEIVDGINDLNGLFLSKSVTTDLYTFSHETILESVMVSFGQLAPEIVIKRCSKRKLYELVRTQNYETKQGEVVLKIPRRYYEDLAQRIINKDDDDGTNIMNTDINRFFFKVWHPSFHDPEFVAVFCDREMPYGLYLLYYILLNNSLTFLVLNQKALFLEILECYGPHVATSVQQENETKLRITVKNIEEVLKNLLGYNDKRTELRTLLQYIFKHPDLRVVLNLRTECGLTALQHCVINGWEDLVDFILQMHEPTTTNDNWACLHLAAYAGRSMLLQKFINLGQCITEKTINDYTVVHTALLGLRYGNQEVNAPYKTIKDLWPGLIFNSLSFPESNEFINIMNILLQATENNQCGIPDLSMAVDEYENSIIHYIVMHNYTDIVDCLLKYDKEFVLQRNRSELPTALHVAVYLGKPDMVKKLWTMGIRLHISDLSLIETCQEGEKFCGRVLSFTKLEGRHYHNGEIILTYLISGLCWNDGVNKMPDMKLKAIEHVKVSYGSVEEFEKVREFIFDKEEFVQGK